MYPPAFDYVSVAAWEDAVAFLEAHADDDPKVLAGGQSLVPVMNLGLAEPSHVVDLNAIPVGEIRREGEALVIPALTRHETLARSALAQHGAPLLAEAASMIGNLRVRHRGTIGGSLAHADPAAELPTALVASGGAVTTIGPGGVRTIPAGEFFVGFYETALGAAELIREVSVPVPPPGTGSAFLEFVRREGDFAVVGIAASLTLDGPGRVAAVRVAACGVGEGPVDLTEAAAPMIGAAADAGLEAAAAVAASLVTPHGGGGVSSSYRRHLVEVLTRRALRLALERAREALA